ncbi:hypothetical protein FPV67DRAFT_210971 [Lyophyllum atratum]|nr:hypothetical protein FPV67DRAFT_210971 [Lyophyllum atratum]
MLAISLVLLQVTWFILQFLARIIQHLPITELEVATLAFAVVNFMIYFCWWNKPLDVQCSIKVKVESAALFDALASARTATLVPTVGARSAVHFSAFEAPPPPLSWQSQPIEDLMSEGGMVPKPTEKHECDTLARPFTTVHSDTQSLAQSTDHGHNEHSPPPALPSPSSLSTRLSFSATSLADHVDLVGTVGFYARPFPSERTVGGSRSDIEHGALTSVRACYFPVKINHGDDAPRHRPTLAARLSARSRGYKQRMTLRGLRQSLRQNWLSAESFLSSLWIALKTPLHRILLKTHREFIQSVVWGDNEQNGDPSDTFYCGHLYHYEKVMAYALASGTAIIFGAIHCIAWSFQFPSNPERILWRASSIMVTFLPAYCFLYGRYVSLAVAHFRTQTEGLSSQYSLHYRFLLRFPNLFTILLYWPALVLYVSARLILLVQMFILLRAADRGIYQTVEWTTFIPHL